MLGNQVLEQREAVFNELAPQMDICLRIPKIYRSHSSKATCLPNGCVVYAPGRMCQQLYIMYMWMRTELGDAMGNGGAHVNRIYKFDLMSLNLFRLNAIEQQGAK